MSQQASDDMNFWQHLEVLRFVILRICGVTLVCMLAAFVFKDEVFSIIFAPQNPDFFTYAFFDRIALLMGHSPDASSFNIELINTGLTRQFMVHIQVALWVGIICASPYIIVELFRFVSPALYSSERKYAVGVTLTGYLMFALGVLVCYFLIFPLTFRFLGTYQVSEQIANLISLESYIDTLTMLSLMMGIMFELPLLGWILAKFGLITATLMRCYRRHAIVAILIAAAAITPTADALTLFLVALPIWLLYEATIFVVAKTKKIN